MKFFIPMMGLWMIYSCSSTRSNITLTAQQKLELDYPIYELYEVSLKNKSRENVGIAVIHKEEQEQIRGFGLSGGGKAVVQVEQESKLLLSNPSDKTVKLHFRLTEENKSTTNSAKQDQYVNFTLFNASARAIPLMIPSVMNPNLSPFSKSGVSLNMGQEILFKERGKKYVLLTVDETIREGDVINVSKLLKQRKKELGLK